MKYRLAASERSGAACRMVVTAVLFAICGCTDQGSTLASSDVSTPDPPPTGSDISFRNQVLPVLQNAGCLGCHGGNGGLSVGSVAQLLTGGIHGPAVIPGNAESSILIRKLLSGPPFGDRMPQGGPFLPDSTVQVFRLWINQGAQNN
jgi:hypothetical protein